MYGTMAAMNTSRHNALAATLARIDTQIAQSDALLLKSPTGEARLRVTSELSYLKTERQSVLRMLKPK